MKIGVIGTGILGLSLGYYLQKKGHTIHFYEKAEYLGGLTCSFDYGSFIWDKFYHVILPRDIDLIELLCETDLESELVWKHTRTGLYTQQTFYSLSNSMEMLSFPLLRPIDKLRMAMGIAYGLKIAKPDSLFLITAKDWLIRYFGSYNYEFFWKPLLGAKFGVYQEKVSAIIIWAILRRMFGARAAGSNKESMGYVRGGYARILAALRQKMELQGATFNLEVDIKSITLSTEFVAETPGSLHLERDSVLVHPAKVTSKADLNFGAEECCLQVRTKTGQQRIDRLDHVVFTAPAEVAQPLLSPQLRQRSQTHNCSSSTTHLGVVCLVLALRRPLTPFYVLNIADDQIPLTGFIEITNLIDAQVETNGLALIYLPRYVDSKDPLFLKSDLEIFQEFVSLGLKKLFPQLKESEIVTWQVQRARYVQPLALVRSDAPALNQPLPGLTPPFQILNSSLLPCAALNSSDVIGLAKNIAAMFPQSV